MFVDHQNRYRSDPWQPKRQKPRLNLRQQRIMAWIVGFNVLMLLFGPLAGATLFQAIWALATN